MMDSNSQQGSKWSVSTAPSGSGDAAEICLFNSQTWVDTLAAVFPLRFSWYRHPALDCPLPLAMNDGIPAALKIALPFSDYVRFGRDYEAIKRGLKNLAEQSGAYSTIVKVADYPEGAPAVAGWQAIRRAVYHRVVVDDLASMEGRLSRVFRRNLNKSHHRQVQVCWCDDRGTIDRFYDLFSRQRRMKFNILSPPRSFFEQVYEQFIQVQRGWFVESRVNGQLLSALLLLVSGNGLYYKFGASDPAGLKYRPNNRLFWAVLQYAAASGYDFVDLGLSLLDGSDDGLIRFKESMGGVAHPVCSLRYDPPGYNSGPEEQWRRMLRGVTRFMVSLDLDSRQIDQAGRWLFHYFI